MVEITDKSGVVERYNDENFFLTSIKVERKFKESEVLFRKFLKEHGYCTFYYKDGWITVNKRMIKRDTDLKLCPNVEITWMEQHGPVPNAGDKIAIIEDLPYIDKKQQLKIYFYIVNSKKVTFNASRNYGNTFRASPYSQSEPPAPPEISLELLDSKVAVFDKKEHSYMFYESTFKRFIDFLKK